jgi:carbon monoxide dehydrogenase subunit G
MANVTRSTVIERPPEAVWNVIGDVERYPEWIDRVDAVTCADDEFGRGTVYRVHGGFGPTTTTSEWRITSWDRPRWQIHKGSVGPVGLVVTFDLEPVDEGTRLQESVEITFLPQFPRIGWWLEVVFLRQIVHLVLQQAMKPRLRRTLRNAKLLSESGATVGRE